jgi:hypothetical protein
MGVWGDMLMPITYSEKTIFSKKSESIADKLLHLDHNDYEDTVLLFKVLAHALRNNEMLIHNFDESIFEQPELLKHNFYVLLQHALSVATAAPATESIRSTNALLKEYTPSQLSKYFGVSTTTIFNWLKDKRFVGVEVAGNNKHNRIPETTEFITSSGKRILVSEVVEMWEKQEAETEHRIESPLDFYTRQIAYYEQKYGGVEFEKALGAKTNLTPEEETDAQIWQHLIRRQQLESRDTKE